MIGAPVSDLDIATDARPETVMDLAEAAGLGSAQWDKPDIPQIDLGG